MELRDRGAVLCLDGELHSARLRLGAHRCTGDVLEACKTTLAGWDPIETCGAGLCNATAGACDECKVGAADCAGAVPRTCDATGHWKLLPACGGSTPVCSAGVCVASG